MKTLGTTKHATLDGAGAPNRPALMCDTLRATVLAKVLTGASGADAEAVWAALGQFVSNGDDYLAQEDDPNPNEVVLIEAARVLLDKMNAAVASLAEGT